jgi:uridine kinase
MGAAYTTPFVVAVCGPSGAGKSTLLSNVAARLGDVVTLHIDAYESSSSYPDIDAWLAGGADPNAFRTPQFSTDLRALRAGQSITLPDDQLRCSSAGSIIMVEEPFGRRRDEMRELIDMVVYIQIAPEIALARKLLRKNAFLPWDEDRAAFTTNLRSLLSWYLASGRAFYQALDHMVLHDHDIMLNGTLPPEQLAESFVQALRARREQ